MDFIEVGSLIASRRKEKKLTQAELAARVNLSRASISGIERGNINEIGFRKILMILLSLGLEINVKEKTSRPTLSQLVNER